MLDVLIRELGRLAEWASGVRPAPATSGRYPGDLPDPAPFVVLRETATAAVVWVLDARPAVSVVEDSGGVAVVSPGSEAVLLTPFDWSAPPAVGGALRPRCRACGAAAGTACNREAGRLMPCGRAAI